MNEAAFRNLGKSGWLTRPAAVCLIMATLVPRLQWVLWVRCAFDSYVDLKPTITVEFDDNLYIMVL